MSMLVTINGEERELPEGATIATAVETLKDRRDGRGLAVALAGEVVPRGAWAQTALREGSQVEVVAAVQGG
jgi:sulfur carrier protein